MPSKALEETELVALSERAIRLKSLTDHPGWAELRATLEERRERKKNSLARRVMSVAGVSQDEIVRNGAFWAGVFAVLDTPEAVEKKLETAVKRAQQEQGEDE